MKNKIMYHWSPTDRRKRIIRQGLLPHQWSTDQLWKPPYICLAQTPRMAWILSGGTVRGNEIEDWDLWEVRLTKMMHNYREIDFNNGLLKEVRVFERIYKRDVWYIGSRTSPKE